MKGEIMEALLNKKPVEIFDYANLERSYRKLLKMYHPDAGGSEKEFIYLTKCYDLAKFEINAGYAIGSSSIDFFHPYYFHVEYQSVTSFPYGDVYVGKNQIIYSFPNDSMKDNLKNMFTTFTFKNKQFKDKLSKQLPNGVSIVDIHSEGKLHRQFMILDKMPGFILLSEVMKHQIPLETSVWIFNRLYGLGCYMSSIGVYNLDISPHTILVNLENHSIQLLGGWWFTAKEGKRITSLPLTTFNLLTNEVKNTKIATIEIVSEQIKNVMREILKERDIPAPYKNWLSLPAKDNIIDEYYQWENEVMVKIFPVRKFYKWTI
jgi:curved DNA-binding protein CbpA